MLHYPLVAICGEFLLQFLSSRPPITQRRVRLRNLELPVQFLLDLFPIFILLHHLDCLQLHLSRIAGPPVSAEGVGLFLASLAAAGGVVFGGLNYHGSLVNVGGWTLCHKLCVSYFFVISSVSQFISP